MSNPDEERSRRNFLHQLGIGFVGLGVAGTWTADSDRSGRIHIHQPADPCAPPTHGAAKAFIRDCRPIRPRQIANKLTPAEVTQLKAAYQAMRALDTSDPADPRGFKRQANIHCFHCAGLPANQMHFSWTFLAWHRAYLYFHERILGKLIGNDNFRLPFWGWDQAGFRALPTPYVTPNDASNPLFNPTRALTPGTLLPDEDINNDVINDTLSLGTTADFVGTASSSGIPEGSPHGPVHVDTGGPSGDMSTFATAAKDPVFYQHHATVDKLWSDWLKTSATHTNPTDAAFLNLTFTFFDENKVWRSIKASQVLDHEHSLRYIYEPYSFFPLLCLLWRPIAINWRGTQRISIGTNRALADLLRGNTAIRLQITGLQVPQDRSTVYRIYGTQAEAQADRGASSPTFIGTVAVVLNDPQNKLPTKGTRNISVTLRASVRAALAQGTALQPFLVDRNERSTAKRIIPVRAADVSLSRGDPDQEK
jgi:polyphenol oxidase